MFEKIGRPAKSQTAHAGGSKCPIRAFNALLHQEFGPTAA
jgi:hypothetical protein